MRHILTSAGCILSLLFAASISPAQTATETVLHSFTDGSDGGQPYAGLAEGADGNFYGTTYYGGTNDDGTVYKISSSGTLTTLHSFCSKTNCADGQYPYGGLIQGADGNFYGTTVNGGTDNDGTIFKITSTGVLTTVYSFTNMSDGANPYGSLILGTDGNFYGTTYNGVNGGLHGAIFKLGPSGILTLLYSFCSLQDCADGDNPRAGLVQGSNGNLYGTTEYGGSGGYGTVFTIPAAGGNVTTLYSFCPDDGACTTGQEPYASLVEGSDGNFYGSTVQSSADGYGTVFRITPTGTLTLVYTFTGAKDAGYSYANLIVGSDGNFYGTASAGGMVGGSAFQLTSSGTLTPLYDFCSLSECADGSYPESNLVQGNDGNFYGTTQNGGTGGGCSSDDCGTVYKLVPSSSLAAPIQLSFSQSPAYLDSPVKLSWKALNAFSDTAQQCYAFVQNSASGAGTWTGQQSGTLSGTDYSGSASITPTELGTYTYALTCGGTVSGFATITVVPAPVKITTSSLSAGAVGTAYSQTLAATGGIAPYTWSIASGSLPAGLTLAASTGIISGTPTAATTSSFTVEVKDSESTPATATTSLSIVVDPAALQVTTASLDGGTVGTAYSQTLAATGGTTPYTWSVSSGSLPAGLTLAASTGIISGTPTVAITSSFTVEVTDSESTPQHATANLSIAVAASGKVSSTTTLSASPNPAVVGQNVTLTATVTGSTGTPTGTIKFYYSTTELGSATLNADGVATFSAPTTGLAAGTYSITADYSGSGNYNPSTSAVYVVTLNSTSASTTTVSASPNPATVGQTVTLTATVTGSSGTPTGRVIFYSSTVELGSATLNSGGVATLSTPTTGLAGGSYSITARYAGSATYKPSNSADYVVSLTSMAPTTTTFAASPNPVTEGNRATLTSTVTRSSGSGTPTGSVTFYFSTLEVGSAPLNGSGIATLSATTAGITAGPYALTAKYNGDSEDASSTSSPVTVIVRPVGESVIFSFCATQNCPSGSTPQGSLIQASDGNFYGPAAGEIYKITPSGDLSVIYTFEDYAGAPDGTGSVAALVEGTDGNFYGTSYGGGTDNDGTVFKITPAGVLTTLYTFCSQGGSSCSDGAGPTSAMVQGTDGNFYGTTAGGGTYGDGTIFKISPGGAYTSLFSFGSSCGTGCTSSLNGNRPVAALVQGTDGALYGTTETGGVYNSGEVYRITTGGAFSVVYSFCSLGGDCTDGGGPESALVEAADGQLYGTTQSAGEFDYGVIFKITTSGTLTPLYQFTGQNDGGQPVNGLLLASDANFYGTTSYGGANGSGGTLFRINSTGTFTNLHSFCADGGCADNDGNGPDSSVLQGADGNLYGADEYAGAGHDGVCGGGCGGIYEYAFSPALSAPVQVGLSSSYVAPGAAFTLTYQVTNAYSDTLQYCFATNTAGNSTWTGVYTGATTTQSVSLAAPTAAGTYTYALTCGGVESGLAMLTVTGEN